MVPKAAKTVRQESASEKYGDSFGIHTVYVPNAIHLNLPSQVAYE